MHGAIPVRGSAGSGDRGGSVGREPPAGGGAVRGERSSAIRWVAEWRASGRTAPRAQGGDRRSDRVEAEADFLLGRVGETPDVTLAELREALWRERGVRVAVSTLWRFFERRRITLKKRRRTPPSRSART
jgi:transposase